MGEEGKRRSCIKPQIAQIYQARARILRFWFWVLSPESWLWEQLTKVQGSGHITYTTLK